MVTSICRLALSTAFPLPTFDSSITEEVIEWVENEADKLVLSYGELNPWTAGALPAPSGERSGKYIGPRSISRFLFLEEGDLERALAHITTMIGEEPFQD